MGLPFPSNENQSFFALPKAETDETPPWKILNVREPTPMSFEIRFRDGHIEAFAYSDFRGAKLVNPGYLIVGLIGMEKMHIVVEGRHLRELSRHLSLGRIDWLGESANRGHEPVEELPHIERIQVDILASP